jgi:hypothetical protein
MRKKVEDIATARFRKQVRNRKFALAPQTEIEELDPHLMDDFLDRIFGITGALVTDESRLSDFTSFGNDAEEGAEAVAKIQLEYGIAVDIHDRLFEVVRMIL